MNLLRSLMKFAAISLCFAIFSGKSQLSYSMSIDQAKMGLPDSVKKTNVIHVATSLGWAPFAYLNESGQPSGFDIELIRLLASKLGVKADVADLAFPSIVPGITSGRYDVGIVQIGITTERAKVVDFVPYFKDDWALLIRKGGKDLDPNDLCGHTIAVTEGSAQAFVLGQLSDKCVQQSKAKILTLYYSKSPDTYNAVASGRAEGFLVAKVTAKYITEKNPIFQVASKTLADQYTTVSGIAVSKQLPGLKEALQAALDGAVRDGSYQKLLVKYGTPESAYSEK